MYGAGGQKRVPPDFCKDFRTPLPPLPEQVAIADYLDRETARIDALTERVRNAIDRLQEYRTALITAAVTGKIDVREATA
jgi:type I restriction enzyme S subunit